jgi:hypothetical protein
MVPQIIPYGKKNELMIQVFRNIRKKLCSKRIGKFSIKNARDHPAIETRNQ